MKISADISSLVSTDRTVIVEHGENEQRRQVVFTITLYKRNHFSEDNEIFRVINEYWASLPEASQAAIFAIYEDIRELFDSVTGNTDLKVELTSLVAKLMEFHHTKQVERWVEYNSLLRVPTGVRGIATEYKFDVDKNTTEDQTYIVKDYIGLMSLSVIFRAMIPIWAMFNKPAKDAIGKTLKEMHSFLLLINSEVYSSESLKRLQRYIKANIGKDTYTGNHTLEFICSDDMPFYLLSLVCVRKLCLGELYSEDPRQNLAALVYTYIIDRPGPHGSDHSMQVREKRIRREGAGENSENSGSTLEIYKARGNVTVGRVAEMEYSLRDPVDIVMRLCPDSNRSVIEKDVKRTLITSEELLARGVQTPQVILSQYVIAPEFPPQGLLYLEEDLIARVCAIAEVVLRHRGFEYLALLSTSIAMVEENGLRVTPVGSKSQIGEALTGQIAKYFPYRREPKRRTATNTDFCFVTEDIKRLSMEFSRHTWRATADEQWVRKVLNTHVRRVPILPQIRTDIASMLIQNEERLELAETI